MAQQSINIDLKLLPQLDPAKLNVILSALKQSLGELGKDIKLLDGDEIAAEFKKIDAELDKQTKGFKAATSEADRLVGSITGAESKASLLTKAFKFNQITQGIATAATALQSFTKPFLDFEQSLDEVQAITGIAGPALDDLGSRAKDLAAQFGGPVTAQLDAFKGVLSRFGPDIAESPEALGRMSTAINTLSKAGGLDAAAAMDVLTNSALQFGVDLSDPIAAAGELEEMMNVLAASSKVGASEIPQVGEAVVVAGTAFKNANISFEETNAAIQTVAAAAGKYGSEAGSGLRNVVGLLQKNSAEAQRLTDSLGIPFEKLGETLTSQGLAPTMELLSDGLNQLGSDAERNAALMQIFGVENASVASALLDNTKMLKDFTAGVTGTNTGIEQAAINMDNTNSKLERLGAVIQGGLITAFDRVGSSITGLLAGTAQIAPQISALSGLGAVIPEGAISSGTAKLKEYGSELKNLPAVLGTVKGKVLEFGKTAGNVALNPKQIATYATTLVSTLVPSFGATATAGTAAGTSIAGAWAAAAGPILPIVGAVAAVAAGMVYLYNTNESFAAAVDTTWGGIKEVVGLVFDTVAEGFSLMGDIASTAFSLVTAPISITLDLLGSLTETLFGTSLVFGDVGETVEFVVSGFEAIIDKVKLFIDANKAIIAGVQQTIDVLKSGFVGGLTSLLSGDFSGAVEKFGSIGEDAANAFKEGAEQSINQSSFERLSDKLSGALEDVEGVNIAVNANADFGNLLSEYEKLQGQITDLELIPESSRTAQEAAQLESLRVKAQEVANQIGETNSEAITSTKSTVDAATGQLVTSYDISISKARELHAAQKEASGSDLAAAQDEYSAKLAKTVELYEEQKNRLKEMQAEATALAESGDEEGAKEKIDEIKEYSKQVAANHEKVQQFLNDGSKAGVIDVDTTVLAKQSLGIEVDIDQEKVKASTKQLENILNASGVTFEPQINLENAIQQYGELQTKIDELRSKESSGTLTQGEQAELDELTRKIEIAGKAIGKMAPEARGNIEFIKDANGNLVESFDINIGKAQEFAAKQRQALESADTSTGEYSASLSEISDIYTRQKQELNTLEKEIEKAMAAGDTTKARELQAEYNKLNGRVKEFGTTLATAYTEGNQEGKVNKEVQEEVRRAFEATDDEIAEMVQKQGEFTDEVNKTAEAATSLGDAFAASVKAAQESQKKALGELAGIDNALNEARSSGNKEEIERLKNLRKEQLALAKDATSEIKNSEKIQENLEYELGLKQRKVKEGDSQLTIAKRELEITNKQIEKEQEKIEHQKELDRIATGRSKNQFDELATLNLSNETLKKQIEEVKKAYQLEFDNEGNAIGVGLRLRKDEKEKEVVRDAVDKIDDLNNQLQKNDAARLKIESELSETPFEKLQRDLEDRTQNLQLRIDNGIVFGDNVLTETLKTLEQNEDQVEAAINESNAKLKKFMEDNSLEGGVVLEDLPADLAAVYKSILDEQKQYTDLSISIEKEKKDTRKGIMEQDLRNTIESIDKRLEAKKEEIEKEKALIDILNEVTSETLNKAVDSEETSRSDNYEREKERIDQLKESELLSEAGHKKKLQELEEKHNEEMAKLAKKRELIQEVERGSQIEADRLHQLQLLENEKSALEERIRAANEAGNYELASSLSKELEKIGQTIDEKGDILTQYATALQGNIQETFSNIGDPEALKDGFREIFGVLAGALKQQASAALTNIVLGQLGLLGPTSGLLALIAVPAIKGLVNAAVGSLINPILSGLTSFATGGRVDEPTLAWVGDKSNATGGTDNTEWVLHDTHIAQIIAKHDEAIARLVGYMVRDVKSGLHMERRELARIVKNSLEQETQTQVDINDTLLRHSLNTLADEIKRVRPHLSNVGITPAQYMQNIQKSVELQRQYISEDHPPSWYNQKIKELKIPRYALGSGPLTEPQLAIVGDNPREPERVTTDSQLREMMELVAEKSNKGLITKMDEMIEAVHGINGRLRVVEKDIYSGYNNYDRKQRGRVRG